VDELEAKVTNELKRAGRLRQSILARDFAGRLVPQDPNDGPAAKLHDSSTARTRAKASGRRKIKKEPQREGNV
jgi:type I restriction enzyme S subunit